MSARAELDPVVERTRAARESLARRCDYDMDKMFALFQLMQAEHPERVRAPAQNGDAAAAREDAARA